MFDLAAFHTAAQHHKTGLALSGGGLRASLFHIGVLGRLAELDLLRHVDVISTVSGGSGSAVPGAGKSLTILRPNKPILYYITARQ